MATIATLAVNLTAKTGAFEKGIKKAGGTVKNALGGAAKIAGGAVAGASAALGVMIKKAIDTGDRVQKLSIATGGSTEFFSEMRRAAELSGTDIEAVGKAMVKLQRRTVAAAEGNKAYAAAFETLNIDLQAFSKLSPDQQFSAIADAVSKVEDPMLRMRAVTDLLGVSASNMIPLLEGGSEAIAAMRAEAAAAGETLTREQADKLAAVNDAVSRLNGSMQGFANQLAIEFAPGITAALDAITARLPFVIDLFGGLFEIVGKLIGAGVAGLVELFRGNFSGVGAIIDQASEDVAAGGRRVARGAEGIFSTEGVEDVVDVQQTGNNILKSIDQNLKTQNGYGL